MNVGHINPHQSNPAEAFLNREVKYIFHHHIRLVIRNQREIQSRRSAHEIGTRIISMLRIKVEYHISLIVSMHDKFPDMNLLK